jgi:hypothetical protein
MSSVTRTSSQLVLEHGEEIEQLAAQASLIAGVAPSLLSRLERSRDRT